MQSSAGIEQDSEGFEQGFKGFEQGSANYNLGSNRILRGSWPHGPPPLVQHSFWASQ